MRRPIGLAGAGLLLLAAAGPAAAIAPTREVIAFTTEPYAIAECDGYEVLEQDDVEAVVQSFSDNSGQTVRDVTHSNTTGTVWRSDTGAQVATFSDAGGTFTSSNGRFTWTGNHSEWTLTDGTVLRFVGRVVVAEVAPGEFERIFSAGSYDDLDPCSW